MNIYKNILELNISKLFNLYDLDKFSRHYGCGDRLYWGWKLSDFANGTLQGGVYSLAVALKCGLIRNKEFTLETIDAAIKAIGKMRAKNGSLVEAYPHENSFCVTALVAYDTLSAIDCLEEILSDEQRQKYFKVIEPLIKFIIRNNEGHAVISNHLATAAAAILLWNKLTNCNHAEYSGLLEKIYANQSDEGWYKEYEGADPGYQTLCTHYLSHIYELTRDERLRDSLAKSAKFLEYFIHPDHTLGGLYGSRNTEVYYPAGIVSAADICDEFALIARELEKGIIEKNNLLPADVDINNFVPLLNSYARASIEYERISGARGSVKKEPVYKSVFERDFKHSGLFIKSTKKYYCVLNYKKGGTVKVFNQETAALDMEDGGIFGFLKSGDKFSTQQFDPAGTFDHYGIKCGFYMIKEPELTCSKFIALRMAAAVFFRTVFLAKLFKKFVIRIFITGKERIRGGTIRKFYFSDDQINITETIEVPPDTVKIGHFGKVKAIHMASSGYYLKQSADMPVASVLVKFHKIA